MISDNYTLERFRSEAAPLLALIQDARSLREVIARLSSHVSAEQFVANAMTETRDGAMLHVVRDCARALRGMLTPRAEQRASFSVAKALWDIARGEPRPELSAGFFAEMKHLVIGLEGKVGAAGAVAAAEAPRLLGRAAALQRSDELDALWRRVEAAMDRFPDGLEERSRAIRAERRRKIAAVYGVSREEFDDWRWQLAHVIRDERMLGEIVPLRMREQEAIAEARRARLPFGVTPYYASLMDEDPAAGRDAALRAQVIPPADYVRHMTANREDRSCEFDFMLERDTSPVDLVTRRYPAIAILKPYNTCPQICVYCQRNWEIENTMARGALAPPEKISEAIAYLAEHPAIREVLITGGDPFALGDEPLLDIARRVAAIPHVELIRFGTRTPVTLPMRITPALAEALGALREPGHRDVAVVTHVEHPYEVTPELVTAVDRLRRNGIAVYNQFVFSFYSSRRFEAAKLRMLLRRCGVDPYYTFAPKGKEETAAYRVPLARILQEQKEEARLLPGSRRTDEAVYNVPGLGKNHLRAFQHRDLIGVLPSGARVYDFHPWEKGVAAREPHVGTDVPILDYLQRLQYEGEDPEDYASIWYYF
jgi:lysine 2,3-aminomutase